MSTATGYITDLDTLHDIFMGEKRPYWRLYAGSTIPTRETSTSKLRGANSEESSMEDSCGMLIERLEQFGAGVFTVALLKSPETNNKQALAVPVKLQGARVGASGSPNTTFGSMMEFIQFMQFMEERNSPNIGATVEALRDEMKKEMEIANLKREIQELKNGGLKDQLARKVVDHIPSIMDRIFPKASVPALAGTVEFLDADPDVESDKIEEQVVFNKGEFSIDQLFAAAMDIQEVLPEIHINELLWKVAKFAKNDPAQMRQLIQML